MADATKIQGQLLDWKDLPDTATDSPSVSSDELSVGAGTVDIELTITVAHTDVNAAGTNYVVANVEKKINGKWYLHQAVQCGGGTAVLEAVVATSNSGQTHIEVADTTDWDTGSGERLFLKDANILDSEIVEIFGWADNDYYIASENLENTHLDTADLLNGLSEHPVYIPNGVAAVRVIFHNADDDANYAVRIDYTAVTEFV